MAGGNLGFVARKRWPSNRLIHNPWSSSLRTQRSPARNSIQPVDPQPMEFLAQDTEVSRQVLEDRGDVRIVDAIGQPISSEAPAGNLDGAIAAHPEIAFAVLRQRSYTPVAQA